MYYTKRKGKVYGVNVGSRRTQGLVDLLVFISFSLCHKTYTLISRILTHDVYRPSCIHFSLLLGCALPSGCLSGFNDWPLDPFAGILSLGIEDTMASMVGYKYGVLLWSKTCSVYCKLMCFCFVCSMVSLDIYTVTRSFSYMSYRLEQEYMSYRLEQEYCFK
ncbi:hypothetical protein L1987_15620 [Smallanthus sonchifolius]|uniref:Uncharacterized protein n=1 Tax=Smallanthus sonchifolius TaxID=185202 RepID=A0ACB9J884_9ASTR|nr:hypothetical protein L1987_15620 [Smallanthus sonchifolius]